MSLKAFHLAFIVISIMLTAYFGGWCLNEYQHEQTQMMISMAVGSFLSTVSLSVYLAWFIKKSKNLGYLIIPLLLAFPEVSNACAVCFGSSDSPLVKAINLGVWVLLSIVGVVLIAFAALFLFWRKRAMKLQ